MSTKTTVQFPHCLSCVSSRPESPPALPYSCSFSNDIARAALKSEMQLALSRDMTSCSCQRGGSRSRSRRLWKALGCDAADYLTDGRARDDFHPLFFFFSPHSMDHQYHQQKTPTPPAPSHSHRFPHGTLSPPQQHHQPHRPPPQRPPQQTSSTTATVHASPASQPNDATSIPMAPEPQQTDDTTPSLPSAATTTNSRELSDFDPRSSSSPPG